MSSDPLTFTPGPALPAGRVESTLDVLQSSAVECDLRVFVVRAVLTSGKVSSFPLFLRGGELVNPEYALDMVTVSVEDERVAFNVEGMDKLWSFRSRLEIPIAHITGVEVNHEQVGRWWHGLKMLGTDLPGLFAAGMFRYHGETVFWDVRDPAHAIIVSLEHETYKKLIVEVADPPATVTILKSAIGRT